MSKLLGGAEDYGKEAGDVQKLGDSPWRFLTVEGKGLPLDGTLGTHHGGEEKGRWFWQNSSIWNREPNQVSGNMVKDPTLPFIVSELSFLPKKKHST